MAYVGHEPVERVVLMENHDEAYYVWRRAGVRGRVLVHVDAHHDMWWTPPHRCVSIADFICPALREGLVREVLWVVPDDTWSGQTGLQAVHRHLTKIAANYPGPRRAPRITYTDSGQINQIEIRAFDAAIRVMPLGRLPSFDHEEILLDVDVDFMMIPTVSYGAHGDRHSVQPWCWPDDLVERLSARGVRTDLATIACSVEGGFTPLRWKYLGEELVEKLRRPDASPARSRAVEGFAAMRRGSEADARHDFATAEREYRDAACCLEASAAPHHRLSLLCAARGQWPEARSAHARARRLDGSYGTAYSSDGFVRYDEGNLDAAEQAHGLALALNPEDPYAHLGLGQVHAQRQNWAESERFLRMSIAIDAHLVDGYRELAQVLTRQGRYGEAIHCYEHSLLLALTGHRPTRGPVVSRPIRGRHVLDPDHSRVHARLAHLHARTGAIEKSIASYRMSAAGGHDSAMLRCRLAFLYLKQRKLRESLKEISHAVALVARPGGESRDRLRHLGDRWRRTPVPETDPKLAL